MNRTLHGRLEMQNFSSSVEKYFQHEKRNFVSPRGHVISSIYIIYQLIRMRAYKIYIKNIYIYLYTLKKYNYSIVSLSCLLELLLMCLFFVFVKISTE